MAVNLIKDELSSSKVTSMRPHVTFEIIFAIRLLSQSFGAAIECQIDQGLLSLGGDQVDNIFPKIDGSFARRDLFGPGEAGGTFQERGLSEEVEEALASLNDFMAGTRFDIVVKMIKKFWNIVDDKLRENLFLTFCI